MIWHIFKTSDDIYARTRPYMITPMTSMYALAIRYVVKNNLPRDIVGCGVLRGESSMISALTLLEYGDTTRTLWLYDTYAGMSEPDHRDIQAFDGKKAHPTWKEHQRDDINLWDYSGLDEV